MRANKLQTALSRDCLACLAPPDMFFHVCTYNIHIRIHIRIDIEYIHTCTFWGVCSYIQFLDLDTCVTEENVLISLVPLLG